jgi:hydrogenase maturation protease
MTGTRRCGKRVLVAGFGSYVQGDDAFGIKLLERVERYLREAFEGVEVLDASTNGMLLVEELTRGYDALILVDAVSRGGSPGTLYVGRVAGVDTTGVELEVLASVAQLHEINPDSAIAVAAALGVLPREVYLVGCEPETIDLRVGLSPRVERCLEEAERALVSLLEAICRG